MKVSSVEEMRHMDREAIEKYGISEEMLMENAGQGACRLAQEKFGSSGRKYVIFCGTGNNGGDGLVLARLLFSYKNSAKVFILGNPSHFKGVAKMEFEIAQRIGLEIIHVLDKKDYMPSLLYSEVIIDAIFGTGLDREVEGVYKEGIEQINASNKPIISLDIPSGINGNTGEVMGNAISADYTLSFGLPKVGELLYPGFSHCGQLYVCNISFPPQLYDNDSLSIYVNDRIPLPARKQDGHKGNFGEVLIIAGAASYYGAPFFAAMSFLKAGGGYSRLACPQSMVPYIACRGNEIVFLPMDETDGGSVAYSNLDRLIQLSAKMDFVILGPGLSRDPDTQKLVLDLVGEIQSPLLIDGDGLSAIAMNLEILKNRRGITILTPHLGEMSALTGIAVDEINHNKISILKAKARELNSVIVLKGAHSMIGYPDGRVYINLSGNSGMATAGSGDVLAGTIAAMSGLGLTIEDAVRKGVLIHGAAGDLAAKVVGEDGMTAQTIMDYLPAALKIDREGKCISYMPSYI